jgi:hypothetical protein
MNDVNITWSDWRYEAIVGHCVSEGECELCNKSWHGDCIFRGNVQWEDWRIVGGICESFGVCNECEHFMRGDCYIRGTVEQFREGCVIGEYCTECDYRFHLIRACGQCSYCNPRIYKPFRPGDVDGDGEITVMDALEILKHLAGISTLTGQGLAAALITGESQPTVADALEILKKIAGIESLVK